ncbi:MAG: hypothetical protein NTV30_05200 [Chloroflexi bacterium]|nr:hypothetical protein [Chloroflexota bacterium]
MKDMVVGLCGSCGKEITMYQPGQKRKDGLNFCNDDCIHKYDKEKPRLDMGYIASLKAGQSKYDYAVKTGEAKRIAHQKTIDELLPDVKEMVGSENVLAVLNGVTEQAKIKTQVIATDSTFIVLDRRPAGIDSFELPYDKLFQVEYKKPKMSAGNLAITIQSKTITVNNMEPQDQDCAIDLLKHLSEKLSKITGKNIVLNHNKGLLTEDWWLTVPQ